VDICQSPKTDVLVKLLVIVLVRLVTFLVRRSEYLAAFSHVLSFITLAKLALRE